MPKWRLVNTIWIKLKLKLNDLLEARLLRKATSLFVSLGVLSWVGSAALPTPSGAATTEEKARVSKAGEPSPAQAGALAVAPALVGHSLFEAGQHCVGYKTQKTLLFVKKVEIIGRNCNASVEVIPDLDQTYYLKVSVPVDGFDSGEPDRDKAVAKILGQPKQSEVVFESKPMSQKAWQDLMAKDQFEIPGTFKVNGNSYPLAIKASRAQGAFGWELDGFVASTFTQFGITPPKIVGGLVARAADKLELHFHLLASKTLGADSLIPASTQLGH
jgi:hypothetical protein